MKKRQVIVLLLILAAVLFLALLHVVLSKNIGPVPQLVEKTVSTSKIQVYDSY